MRDGAKLSGAPAQSNGRSQPALPELSASPRLASAFGGIASMQSAYLRELVSATTSRKCIAIRLPQLPSRGNIEGVPSIAPGLAPAQRVALASLFPSRWQNSTCRSLGSRRAKPRAPRGPHCCLRRRVAGLGGSIRQPILAAQLATHTVCRGRRRRGRSRSSASVAQSSGSCVVARL